MAAKKIGLTAADVMSSSSAWSRAIPGPASFNWNGFAIDLTHQVGESFHSMVRANPVLTASPDGKFVYGMSRFGNDLTILRAEDGSVVTKLAIGGDSLGVLRADRGSLLCAWSGKQLHWLDMRTNEVRTVQRPCHGRFVRIQPDPQGDWFVTFSEHCAQFWDTGTGALLASIENLGKPRFVMPSVALKESASGKE
jgi:hypothetical protein